MSDDIAIKVEHVSKEFRLPHEKNTSIKGALINLAHTGKKNRSYERQQALKDVSFEIKKGEFFGIIGRNGSGKSTLLKMLAGIYMPTRGHIQVNGKLTPFIELGVGFNPELTGRENVFLNGALLGFNRKEMETMYEDIVKFAELEKFMDQKLKNYSSGMQVRLAFSIAIRAQTDILLLDEVLAVGDQNFQEKCFKYFESIKKSNATVILVSHDSGAIERFCSRVAIVDRGDLVDIGPAKEMVLQYGALLAEEQYEQSEKSDTGSRHQGTGTVVIGEVEIINKKGAPIHVVHADGVFGIRAQYKLKGGLEEGVVIGVDIIDKDGVSVLGPNTKESIKEQVVLDKNGVVEAMFMQNPISPGTYSITVGIFNERATYAHDLVENATQFKIIGERRHGKIYIEPRWTIT